MFDFTDALDTAHRLAQFMISEDLVDDSGDVFGACCFARLARKRGQGGRFCVELDVWVLDTRKQWGGALVDRGYMFQCTDAHFDMDEYIMINPVFMDLPCDLDCASWKSWDAEAAALFSAEVSGLLSMLSASGVRSWVKQRRPIAA
jgi:hypothetical protein